MTVTRAFMLPGPTVWLLLLGVSLYSGRLVPIALATESCYQALIHTKWLTHLATTTCSSLCLAYVTLGTFPTGESLTPPWSLDTTVDVARLQVSSGSVVKGHGLSLCPSDWHSSLSPLPPLLHAWPFVIYKKKGRAPGGFSLNIYEMQRNTLQKRFLRECMKILIFHKCPSSRRSSIY